MFTDKDGTNHKPVDKSKVKESALVFTTRMDATGKTDAQLRLMIRTLRQVILDRQRRRAAGNKD